MSKRSEHPTEPEQSGTLILKRQRGETPPQTQIAISSGRDEKSQGLIRTVQRTSNLEAPIISLSGAHTGEILSCRFDPSGQNIAAVSSDRSLSLWKTYPPNNNYGHITALHKAPIIDLQWSLTSSNIYTVSADKSLSFTDVTTGERVRKIRGAHSGMINSLDRVLAGGTELLASGGDDNYVRLWDAEGTKDAVAEWNVGAPVTSVCWSADGAQVYVGAVDNAIHVYDVRKQEEVITLRGHTDTPSSLSLSPSGTHILSPSFSSTTIIWDIRPFSPSPDRVHRVLQGAPAGFENILVKGAWSREDGGKRVAVGGADRTVTIWDVDSGRVLYKLPGHKGTVTAVDFHPKEPIVLTGSTDSTMLLGELERTS
ncbi:WD40 repeat-like protein [Clavulina sp. PMI_390]|nr:WD40 repeat-like protein [Clavulina sp. PMI_390]